MYGRNTNRQSRERKIKRPDGNKEHVCIRKTRNRRNDDEPECEQLMCEYVGKISLTRKRFDKIRRRLLRNTKESNERTGVTTRKMLRDEEIKKFLTPTVYESKSSDSDFIKTGCLEWSSEEMLLYPQPQMTLVPNPHFQLSKMQCVHLREDNLLVTSVNGLGTVMYVDSGCTACFIRYELAEQLGMLQYAVGETRRQLYMWSSVRTFTLTVIQNVPVQIQGGPMFYLRGLVFRRGEAPNHFLDIMLDNGTLRRLKVIQAFHPGGSTLYFRDSAMKRTSARNDRGMQYLMKAILSTTKKATAVSVHLDSGASFVYLSRECMDRVQSSIPPKSLYINVRSDLWVCHDKLIEVAGNNDYDVIFGSKFFSRHWCILDYFRRKLYLQVKDDFWSSSLISGAVDANKIL